MGPSRRTRSCAATGRGSCGRASRRRWGPATGRRRSRRSPPAPRSKCPTAKTCFDGLGTRPTTAAVTTASVPSEPTRNLARSNGGAPGQPVEPVAAGLAPVRGKPVAIASACSARIRGQPAAGSAPRASRRPPGGPARPRRARPSRVVDAVGQHEVELARRGRSSSRTAASRCRPSCCRSCRRSSPGWTSRCPGRTSARARRRRGSGRPGRRRAAPAPCGPRGRAR